jgi:hypothetical protein
VLFGFRDDAVIFGIACCDRECPVKDAVLGSDFFAFEHLHRLARHDRRDGVLVDKLRMTIATQQDAEIVERRNNAREFYTVDEKNRQ